MLSDAADQKPVQETPGKNNKEALAKRTPGAAASGGLDFVLGISLAAIITLAVLVGFLTGTLSIKTVFAKGSAEIVATKPEIKVSLHRGAHG